MSSQQVDIAVVGKRCAGSVDRGEVARRASEVRIAVLGPRDRPAAASTAAGAMLNCFGEVATGTARHPAARAKFAIARQALDLWPTWLEMVGDEADSPDGLRHTPGTTVVLSGRSGEVATRNFEAMRAALVEHGEPYDVLDPSDVEDLAPEPDARPTHAMHLRREGAVDARAVIGAFDAAARRLGVDFVDGIAHELIAEGGAVRGVVLRDGGRIAARTVVLAAGSHNRALADAVLPTGAEAPVWHGTGLALLAEQPSGHQRARHVLSTPNRAAACGLHLVPLAGAQYVGPPISSPPIRRPAPTSGPVRRSCGRCASSSTTACHVHRWLHGVRPVSLDGFPLIGRCGVDGLIFATGTHRDGLHCSPAIATHLARDILDRPTADERFAWFTPERPLIQTSNLDQAIDEATAHLADAAAEYGLVLPFWLDVDTVHDWARQRVERVYDDLGVDLSPEIVVVTRALIDPQRERLLRRYARAAARHHTNSDPASREVEHAGQAGGR